eukprot:TRINITY_DN93309_c0_g1_i1.p1 TRINITY_DN93309_c0_g1~~TRINITY_DN93309_c0_g1_i1.p1  ORF type:complete len:523 (-),score=110.52 TRINITY_DN93309_c0_g1_i1:8-1483(-)
MSGGDSGTPPVRYMPLEEAQDSAAEDTSSSAARRQYYANLLENPDSGVHCFLLSLIFLATATTILETVPELREHKALFQGMDYIITACFSVELCVRLYISDSCANFVTNWYNIIDIFAVVPSYLELVLFFWHFKSSHMHQAVGSMRTLRMTRIIRLVRLVRVVRVVRLVNEWHVLEQMVLLFRVLSEAAVHTGGSAILLLLGSTTLMAACLIYVFEVPPCEGRQVEEPGDIFLGLQSARFGPAPKTHDLDYCAGVMSHFDSIPAAWWWAIITLTTVGYGDMIPHTVMGKLVGSFMCVGAVMMVAIAAAQFSTHFRERWVQLKASHQIRKHFAGDKAMAEEQRELEELLGQFQQSMDELLEKVALLSVSAGGGSIPEAIVPLLKSLESNSQSLTSGACSYMYEVLAEAMLRRQAANGDFSRTTSPKDPSWSTSAVEHGEMQAEAFEDSDMKRSLVLPTRLLATPLTQDSHIEELKPLKLADRLERRLFTSPS